MKILKLSLLAGLCLLAGRSAQAAPTAGGVFTSDATNPVGSTVTIGSTTVALTGPGVKFAGGSGQTDVTVNGVTFTAVAGANPTGNLTGTLSGVGYALNGAQNPFNTYSAGSVSGNSNLLSNGFDYGGPAESLSFTGLTAGQTYVFAQYNFAFGDNAQAIGGRIEQITDSATAVPLIYDENSSGGAGGNILYDVFTPTGTTFSINYTVNPPNTADSMHQYDFQLTALVPEPTSVVLFGLGAVGLFCVARKRRQS